jgi:hypothetical protein
MGCLDTLAASLPWAAALRSCKTQALLFLQQACIQLNNVSHSGAATVLTIIVQLSVGF